MELISSRDMQILDTNCEFFGLSRLVLMENAGRGVAEEISARFYGGKVYVFAGGGNNGGDGFVAARHLKGFDVEIYLLATPKTEISAKNLEICKKAGIPVYNGLPSEVSADIVVDAMLGTGVRGRLREPYSTAVELVNSCDAFKVAVDIPSGLDPDTGSYEAAVRADLTVTFHKLKPGILKAKEICGEVVVKDIGIPETFERLCGVGDVKFSYKRIEDAHKGMHGRVLVIGGGEFTGAPALASLAAYYSGADIVTTAVPEAIRKVVASFSPNLIVRGVGRESIGLENLPQLENLVKKHDVLVAGMGVGENPEFLLVIEELLKSCKKAVLDAQGLTKNVPENCQCILTPHRGEFRKVFGDLEVEKAAKIAKAVILLKGKEDVITDGERTKFNRSGNAGMTVGGTGDVLAGICGAFLCNDDAFHAACAAAFTNGFAGDLCFEKYGYNYTAMEVIQFIPEAIRRCTNF